jgi:phage tail tube protein FII
MAKEIFTRIQLKHDSLTNWNESSIVLKPGEVGVAYVDVATKDAKGNIIHVPTALLKVGENKANSTATFNQLPFVSALAADVYAWAKKEGIDVIDEGQGEVLSDVHWDAEKQALVLSRTDVVTPAELTETLKSYYTKTEIDTLLQAINESIADLEIGALEGRVDALETATTETLPGQISAVDAKFASYTTTSAQQAIDAEQDRRIKVIEDDYLVEADIANFETKENVQKVADDLAGYVESNDAALAEVRGIADAAQTAEEVAAAINAKVTELDLGNTYEAKGEAAKVSEALENYKTSNDAAVALKADKTALAETDEALAALKGRVEAFLDNTGAATEAIDTLQELLTYINTHDDVEISGILADIQALENKLAGIDTTVAAYVTAAIEALKIGDYAKAADLTALAGRVEVLEGKPAVEITAQQIANWDGEVGAKALAGTKLDATTFTQYQEAHKDDYTNAQIDANVKVVADDLGAYKTANNAAVALKADKSVVDAMYTNEQIDAKVKTAQDIAEAALPKATAEADYVKKADAPGYGDILTKTSAGTIYRAKADKITSDDLSDEVFVFNCGTASTVL